MKKLSLVMAAILVLFIVFPAFVAGGGQQSASDVKRMSYTFWGSDLERNAQNAAVAAFNQQNPGIIVEPMHIPSAGNEYTIRVTAMVNAGNAPDVGYLAAGLSFVWAREGRLYNIFDFLDKDPEYSRNTYVDNIYYYFAEGKSHGTTSTINSMGIFYSKPAFDTAGLPYPPVDPANAWTWEQFIDVAQTLTLDMQGRNAKDPNFNRNQIRQYGVLITPNYAPQLMNFLDMNGADLLTPDGSRLALDTPEAMDTLQKLSDLINKYYVCPAPTAASEIGETPQALLGRRAAMSISGPWHLLDLPQVVGTNWGIGALPKLKEYRNVIFAGIRCIFTDTKYPQESWELFKFLQNPSGAMSLYQNGLWQPVLKEWYDNPSLYNQWAGPGNPARPSPGFKEVFVDHLFQGLSTPDWTLRINNSNDILAAVNAALDPLWLGTQTVDEAVRNATQQVNPIVQGFNPNTYHASRYRR